MAGISGMEFEPGGMAEVGITAAEVQGIADLLGSVGPNLYVHYTAYGGTSEQIRVEDAADAPIFLIREREHIPTFMKAAQNHGLTLEVAPIYHRENAKQMVQEANLYATRLFLLYGVVTPPEMLTVDYLFERGETHVGIRVSDPKNPGKALDEEVHSEFARHLNKLLPHPEVPEGEDSLIELARQDLGRLFAHMTPEEAHKAGSWYFIDLFRDDLPREYQLESLFIGATAHGHDHLAGNARCALYELGWEETDESTAQIDKNMINLLEIAMWKERRNHGSIRRVNRLRETAQELGQPRRRQLMGACATKFAQLKGNL